MTILPRRARSTSENSEFSEFWRAAASVPMWPGRKGDIRTAAALPAEDPFLLSARPAAGINPEVTALLAAAGFEAAVMQNLQMLAAS